jgi:hypothetical protein
MTSRRLIEIACNKSQTEINALNTMELNNSVFKTIMNFKDFNTEKFDVPKASTYTVDETIYIDISRDTDDWVPPNRAKSVQSFEINIDEPGCSRELFTLQNVIPTINNESDVNIEAYEDNNIILEISNSDQDSIDEIDVVGKAGLKRRKIQINNQERTNKKKKQKLRGDGKYVKPDPCKKGCRNNCSMKLTEEAREAIFKEYWNFENKMRQRDFLLNCTNTIDVKRSRVVNSRKKTTKVHYLFFQSEEYQVCQQYLLKTLDISQKMLNNAVKKQSPVGMAGADTFIQKLPAFQ